MIKLALAGLGYWGPNLMRDFDRLKDCEVAIKEKEEFFESKKNNTFC